MRQPLAIRYAGLGAYSRNFVDIFSGTSNQAALAELKSGALGLYGERRFLMEELNQFSALVAMPTTSGTFALQGDYFGSSAFNENQLGLAYARTITKQINAGVKFNYHTINLAGYGNASAVNFEMGAVFHLTEKLHAGLHVYNPLSAKLGKTGNEKLPSVFKAGCGYEPSQLLYVSAEILKQEDQPVSVSIGIQYNLHEKVLLRAGINTLTNNAYAGVGVQLGFARVDINVSYHPQLGITPGLLLLFQFQNPSGN